MGPLASKLRQEEDSSCRCDVPAEEQGEDMSSHVGRIFALLRWACVRWVASAEELLKLREHMGHSNTMLTMGNVMIHRLVLWFANRLTVHRAG